MGRTIDITLDTCFKEFVEKVRGIRFVDVAQGTPLYRDLLREFATSPSGSTWMMKRGRNTGGPG